VLEFLKESDIWKSDESLSTRIAELASGEGLVADTARLMLGPESSSEPLPSKDSTA
jgi:hypothetical protein